MSKHPDAPYEEEVYIAEQPHEATKEEMEEAYYWMTISDFVGLIMEHGQTKVMEDFKTVARKMRAEIEKEHPIILV